MCRPRLTNLRLVTLQDVPTVNWSAYTASHVAYGRTRIAATMFVKILLVPRRFKFLGLPWLWNDVWSTMSNEMHLPHTGIFQLFRTDVCTESQRELPSQGRVTWRSHVEVSYWLLWKVGICFPKVTLFFLWRYSYLCCKQYQLFWQQFNHNNP